MKAVGSALLSWLVVALLANRSAYGENIILGFSGTGTSSDLRHVIERENIWQKYGLNVQSVYFNSGGVLAQAMASGQILTSDSGVPEMLTLPVAGILDAKVLAVTMNRLEHFFVARKTIGKPEDLKGKRVAVSRIGSASDLTTRLVLRSWRLDPEKEIVFLQAGNTPTRMMALMTGHVDAALVSPDSMHKVTASGCCRILADLSDLPLDYARFGVSLPTAVIKTQRDMARRLVLAYIEGIYLFKTRPNLVASIFRDEGLTDAVAAKELYNRISRSFREYPIPEPNGIQNALDSIGHPNAKNFKPADLVDTSIIEQIKKSGFIDKLYGR